MEQDRDREPHELRRLRSELKDVEEEIARLREGTKADARTIRGLRRSASRDANEIDHLHQEAADAEREMVDLRAIRDALIEPALVQREGMTIAAEVMPASPHVGGDFFFVGDGPNDTAVIAMGDVVGKGLTAARRSAFIRTAMASVAPFSDDPCQLLQWVNSALVERAGETAEFATAACMTYHPGSRVLRLASAGHPPALRLGSGAELNGENIAAALGLTREIHCTPSVEQLAAGDGLLLYTDGTIEARGATERYGTDRLAAALRAGSRLAPPETLEFLKRDLREFAGGELNDDVGLLILRTG